MYICNMSLCGKSSNFTVINFDFHPLETGGGGDKIKCQ